MALNVIMDDVYAIDILCYTVMDVSWGIGREFAKNFVLQFMQTPIFGLS